MGTLRTVTHLVSPVSPSRIFGDIAAQVVFGWPVSVIFYRKSRLILRCSLSKAHNCRLDFSVPLTVLSLSDRAQRPSPQESRSPIDDRVGMRKAWIPFKSMGCDASEIILCGFSIGESLSVTH
jgi:hypothetical protein